MLEVVRPPVPSARGGAIAYQASFSPDPPSHFIFFSSSQIYRAFSSLQFFFFTFGYYSRNLPANGTC